MDTNDWKKGKDRITIFLPKGSAKDIKIKALNRNKSLSKYVKNCIDYYEKSKSKKE